MTRTAIIFGGKSCEHDVSIVTGVQMLCGAVELVLLPIYIDREGVWRTGGDMKSLETYRRPERMKRVHMRPGGRALYGEHGRRLAELDAAVLCCHGAGGEDGCLQGFLELCALPYTGADVLTSALCMDKSALKRYLAGEAEMLPCVTFTREEFERDVYAVAEKLDRIGYPFIVKPARLGSSIGVSAARNGAELVEAVRVAGAFDCKIVVEKLLEGFRELNCAALGDGKDVRVSEAEEPLGWKEFLKYEDKYSGGKSGMTRRLPADIDEGVRREIRSITARVFALLGLNGVARMDYMLTADGKLYLNEINTLPGSLAAYFFRREGMTDSELVTRLLELAKARAAREASRSYTYRSGTVCPKG